MPTQHLENGADLKMWQHNLVRALEQERQRIKAGAVRDRCREQMGVALVEPIDIGVVALAHEQEVAVRQYPPFGRPVVPEV